MKPERLCVAVDLIFSNKANTRLAKTIVAKTIVRAKIAGRRIRRRVRLDRVKSATARR